jgi:O-antigen/teichoic acid export membrane protein
VEEATSRGSETPAPGGGSGVAKGGAQIFVYRVVELAAQGLMIIITARLLEPEGRGLYSLAALTAMLCVIPLGAVWMANAYEMAHRRVPADEILGASVVMAVLGGTLIALVAFTITPFLGDRWWVVAFPAATTPFLLLGRYGDGLFQSLGHIHAVGLITLARVVVPLVFITVPLLAGADDRTAIGVWTVSLIVVTVLIYVPLRRVTGGQRLPRDRGLYGRITRFGLRLSPATAGMVGASRAGLVVLAAMVSAEAVGVYSVAIAVGEVLYLSSYALQVSAFRHIGAGGRDSSISLSARALRHAVLLAGVGGLLIAPASLVALPVIIGPGYEDVPLLLALLVPGIIAQAGSLTLSTFFTVQIGKPEQVTKATLTMAGLSIVLCIPAVAVFGVWGAALAASVANIIGALIMVRYFHHETGTRLRDLMPGAAEVTDYRHLTRSLLRRTSAGGAL